MGKGTSRKAPRAPEWGIVVCLADGERLHLCAEGAGRSGRRWGYESQAQRFETAEEAERLAATFQTNSAAKEYLVVRLPQPKRR